MNPKLPVVKSKELVSALEKTGFSLKRQTGSHAILHKPGERRIITVPIHTGDLPSGTLRAIIRQANISVDDLINILK